MNQAVCVGIAARENTFEVVVLEPGQPALALQVPASESGLRTIQSHLDSPRAVRLAVAGMAAIALALALGQGPRREVFIVSSAVASQALALAHYAHRSA